MGPIKGLCLTRKEGEEVMIRLDGKLIMRVMIVHLQKNKCSVMFDTAKDFEILRRELDERTYPDDYREAT